MGPCGMTVEQCREERIARASYRVSGDFQNCERGFTCNDNRQDRWLCQTTPHGLSFKGIRKDSLSNTIQHASKYAYTFPSVIPVYIPAVSPHLEMLFPELEVHLLALSLLTSLVDIPRCNIRSTEVHTDLCAQRALQAVHVGAVQDAVAHATEQALEVWATEVGS